MEEKVAETLKIIDESGDSFAQRAEMYYRKRPELVSFVEEAFRAYRALAERYDHLSKELQSANRTIASVFPEQVRYRIDEDDDEESFLGANSSSPDPDNQTQKPGIPKAPNIPKKNFRSKSMSLSKKGPLRRNVSSAKSVSTILSSGLSKDEALSEIDKLQKEILALQTEKEFVRSLYEHSYEKYWKIEDQITGMQKRICSLQDEFGIGTVIEDNDARVLMAATALNSCKETLAKLQEVQAQSSEEAKAAYENVKEAHDRFETLRDQFISKHRSQHDQGTEPKSIDEDPVSLEEEMHEHDVGLLRERIKEKLEEDSANSLTMTEMAEKIDELVNKVVSLETAVTSQTGLVKRLRSETDELQKNIQGLEEDKEMLIEDSEKMNKKLKELEEELRRVKNLNWSVKKQDNSLQTHFIEANCNLEHLSGSLNNVKLDEEGENLELYKNKSVPDGKLREESEKPGDRLSTDNLTIMNDVKTTKEEKEDFDANFSDVRNEDDTFNLKENIDFRTEGIPQITQQDKDDLSETVSNLDSESLDLGTGQEKDQPTWRQMFASGLDDREKILLDEYTSVLKNYNDARDKLNDVEKKNRDSVFELALQVRELKDVVATKDKEINFLQGKLTCPETNPDESPSTILTNYKYTPQEALLRNASLGANMMQDPETPSSDIVDTSVVSNSFAEQHQPLENTGNIAISTVHARLWKVRANLVDKNHSLSALEKKFRSEIDDLLEENLEFWLRFSTSVHQIQKFQNSIQDLKAELRNIKDSNIIEGNSNSIKSEMKPIFRELREIRTELSVWLEHNELLQDELQGRHPSLCSLQDEIARAANPDSALELSGYQAAKFQGEVLNMKQENTKVSSELQAGLSFVKGLKNEVEKMLEEVSQAIGVNNNGYGQEKHSTSRGRIPLRSFLFGIKLKKQRQSVFACVNPTLQRQYSDLAEANDAPI
ncbi:Protein Networked [Sesbania bispinosa]|nr:Protein Networked [Sesbania bispinosa]